MEVVETVDRFIDAELRAGAGEAAEGVTNWATFAGNGGPRFYLRTTRSRTTRSLPSRC